MIAAPFWDSLVLGAIDRAPGTARGHAQIVLREWGLDRLWDTAEFIISELVTNCYQATEQVPWPGGRPPVQFFMRGDPHRVCLLAWDAVARMPAPRVAGDMDESGRGLEIVEALSAAWGCYDVPPPLGGKVTWALVGAPWRDQPPR
jgi:hypothetical protein